MDRFFGSLFRSPSSVPPFGAHTPTSPPEGGKDQSLPRHEGWREIPELPLHVGWPAHHPPPPAPSLPPSPGPKGGAEPSEVSTLCADDINGVLWSGLRKSWWSWVDGERMARVVVWMGGDRMGGDEESGLTPRTGSPRLGVVRVFHAHAHLRGGTQSLLYGTQRRRVMDYGPAPCVQRI